MSKVKYRVQSFDGPRTMEQQSYLLASAVRRVWEGWAYSGKEDGAGGAVQGVDENFDNAMRYMYQQLKEMDIFMSGVKSERGDVDV